MGLLPALMNAGAELSDAEDQAGALERGALRSEMAGGDARRRGNREAGLIRMAASQAIGRQTVAQGVSGVDSNSGTALEQLGDSRLLSELDIQTAQNNAAREAWGYRAEAAEQRYGAQRARQRGVNRAASSFLGSIFNSIGQGVAMGIGGPH